MLIITRANAKKNWLTQKFQSYIVKIVKNLYNTHYF